MSSWKSHPSPCGCARKPCNRTNERKVRTPLSKSRERQAQIRNRRKEQSSIANVSGAVQLWNDLRRGRKLRSPGDGLEPLSHLSRLRQKARSQEPAVADGIPSRGVLEGRRMLGGERRPGLDTLR